ncbi:MAG TPA: cation:proton antiporter [Ktedonobacterales bacterium]|nr:cation:proton antiporter [Ktedonobacterales bacterium]
MTTHEALILLLIAAGALIAPLLSERIGWFTAPCEALYGALVATFIPDAHAPGQFISGLAELSFLLLMFLVGLEIDFTLLRERGLKALARAFAVVVGIQAAALLLTMALRQPPIVALLGGALSVSLLLVVMQQQGIVHTHFGQQALLVASLGEFLAIIELTGYDLVARYGADWSLAVAAIKLVALLLAGVLALRALLWLAKEHPGRVARLFRVSDSAEVGVRAALALMLAFTAIAAFLRIEQILATFIAGMVSGYAFRRERIVTHKLMTIGQGFFLPIFFITVGMSLRLTDMLNLATLGQMLLLLGIIAATRLLAAPQLHSLGLSWRQAGAGALLLSAPLTLLVAIAQVGINLGQLSPASQGVTIGAAVAGAILFPLLARPLVRHSVPTPERAPAVTDITPLIDARRAAASRPSAISWPLIDAPGIPYIKTVPLAGRPARPARAHSSWRA